MSKKNKVEVQVISQRYFAEDKHWRAEVYDEIEHKTREVTFPFSPGVGEIVEVNTWR